MNRFQQLTALAFATCLSGGCDLPPEEPDNIEDLTSFRGTGGGSGSGLGLNTNWLGHTPISEFDLERQDHGGSILHEVLLGGKVVEDLHVEEDVLTGLVGGIPRSGTDFIGAIFVVELTSGPNTGEMAEMQITDIIRVDNEGRMVYRFGDLTFNDGLPTCEADLNGSYEAALYSDISVDPVTAEVTERPHTLYIGCLSGAMGKASVRWGYWPFELGAERFTAVIRMLRADFCGDGTSWTSPGQILQVRDHFGVSNTFANPYQNTEAVWNAEGAVCIGEFTRLGDFWEDVVCNGSVLTQCATEAEADDAFHSRGQLWSKLY